MQGPEATTPAVIGYIGVGSNIEPEANILRALERLRADVRVTGTSTFYWTPAIDRPEQPDYLNGVWQVEASLPPREIKYDLLRRIEAELGRVRGGDKYAPRCIDLDLLLCGDHVVNDPDCRVPAPELRSRPFMVIALLELSPDLVLPDTDEPLAGLVRPGDATAFEPAEGFTQRLRERIR